MGVEVLSKRCTEKPTTPRSGEWVVYTSPESIPEAWKDRVQLKRSQIRGCKRLYWKNDCFVTVRKNSILVLFDDGSLGAYTARQFEAEMEPQ